MRVCLLMGERASEWVSEYFLRTALLIPRQRSNHPNSAFVVVCECNDGVIVGWGQPRESWPLDAQSVTWRWPDSLICCARAAPPPVADKTAVVAHRAPPPRVDYPVIALMAPNVFYTDRRGVMRTYIYIYVYKCIIHVTVRACVYVCKGKGWKGGWKSEWGGWSRAHNIIIL